MKPGDTVIGLNVPGMIPSRIGKTGRILHLSNLGRMWIVEWRPGDINGMFPEELAVVRPVVAS